MGRSVVVQIWPVAESFSNRTSPRAAGTSTTREYGVAIFSETPHPNSQDKSAGFLKMLPDLRIAASVAGLRKFKRIVRFVRPTVIHAASRDALKFSQLASGRGSRPRYLWSRAGEPHGATTSRVLRIRNVLASFRTFLETEMTDGPGGPSVTDSTSFVSVSPGSVSSATTFSGDTVPGELEAIYRAKHAAVFPRYALDGASSRVRHYQFRDVLQRNGWILHFFPLFNAGYLPRRYAKKYPAWEVISGFFRRVFALRMARATDLLWVEKEVFPWIPAVFERALLPRVPYLFDLDDALHHYYSGHQNLLVRTFLGRKVASFAGRASFSTFGNSTLQADLEEAVQGKAAVIPSVVDAQSASARARPGKNNKFVIGWIGTPVSFAAYVESKLADFQAIAEELDGEFWIIGHTPNLRPLQQHVRYIPWSMETEEEILRKLTVGIMPLTDSPWSRGKCGFKLIQYMAAGIPVVASPVGVNPEIVVDGTTGFLAHSHQDWRDQLKFLKENPKISAEFGQNGAVRVLQKFSIQAATNPLLAAFTAAHHDLSPELHRSRSH